MQKMTKFKLALTLVIMGVNVVMAQNPFKFLKVDFVGAMSASDDWTKDWSNWDPKQTNYPAATELTTLNAAATGSGKIEISSDLTLDASKVYLLTGIVYVKNGATLTIPAGTKIRCEGNPSATPANWASLVVQRGGKLLCNGISTNPIVFTSNKPAGSRNSGDWGGIILLGKGQNNLPGGQSGCTQCVKGEGLIEGPFGYPDGVYGGNDDADGSGSIMYTRIEFPGLVFAANNEVNGLTMGSVGYNTLIRYVQVSYSNDDSYEWYGGTVNSKYLIAFRGVDDDFDTDFGYRGHNQFGIGVKDSIHFDATWNASSGSSTSEGFESDNDGSGSTNRPKTAAVFSNYTMVGPYAIGETYNQHSTTVKGAYRRGARIRRNSAQSIVNSIFMGYRNGIMLDGSATEGNANVASGPAASDSLLVRNCILLGMTAPKSLTATSIVEVATGRDTGAVASWLRKGNNRINPVAWSAGTLLVNPTPYSTTPDFRPVSSSPAVSGSDFSFAKTPFELGVKYLTNTGSIKVYPNPSNGVANLELNLINNTNLTISLNTVDGKVVKYLNDNYSAGTTVIRFEDLSQGIYFVKVAQNESFNTFKLIVK
jgi:hypothetical protein